MTIPHQGGADDMKKYHHNLLTILMTLLLLADCSLAQQSNPEWCIYNSSNSGLPGDFILCMTIDHSGAVWIGGEFSNITKFDGVNWTVHNIHAGEIISLATDSRDNIWIGSDGGPLTRFDGISFRQYLPARNARYVASDGNDQIWVGNFQGLSKFDGFNWTHFDTSNSDLPFPMITSIAPDQNGQIWARGADDFGISRQGLLSFDGVTGKTFSEFTPVPWPQSIAIDDHGFKWIGTQDRLVSFIEIFSQPIYQEFSPPDSSLYYVGAVAIDSHNNKWLGFDSGLARFDGENWQIWTKENSPLPPNWRNDPVWVTAIVIDEYDNKWLGTYGGGLVVFNENGIVTHISEPNVASSPNNFMLEQNYPNPFNPETTINYHVLRTSEVTISIFNADGQLIRTLKDGTQQKGLYQVVWDGKNDDGKQTASGLYFIRMQAGKFVKSIKAVLVR